MTPYDGVCIEQLPANIAGILIVIGRVAASLCFKAKLAGKQMTGKLFFCSHATKTHLHKRGFARSLVLKVRVFGTRKWSFPLRHLDTLMP